VVVLLGDTVVEPLTGSLPDQLPPLAVQVDVFVLLQVNVDCCPPLICAGLAVSVTVGALAVVTVTLAAVCVEPPIPVQDST